MGPGRGRQLRDSALFSVIEAEWPAVKSALAARVARATELRSVLTARRGLVIVPGGQYQVMMSTVRRPAPHHQVPLSASSLERSMNPVR